MHTDMKVRPLRIAARRANELMGVIQNLEHHDVEWLVENDVDIPKSDENAYFKTSDVTRSFVLFNSDVRWASNGCCTSRKIYRGSSAKLKLPPLDAASRDDLNLLYCVS
ncbi:hypothetical protein EVAR_90080_1 [Eumeta japonica]|uniref:Uncharacterized protein n=1 Tax=Eumeta variegata TaxID=151549 RepID=A0A4C1X215_EUMVA|nr:hypothetical protein EVAR_90080_1 [Eumeta japonica]